MAHTTIQQALQRVADHPHPETDNALQTPTHELVCRSLFDIANNPDAKVRGSMARANRARKLIFDRLVGKRKPGTHPATRVGGAEVEFVDLTSHQLEGGKVDE
jgi:hypothetical protein